MGVGSTCGSARKPDPKQLYICKYEWDRWKLVNDRKDESGKRKTRDGEVILTDDTEMKYVQQLKVLMEVTHGIQESLGDQKGVRPRSMQFAVERGIKGSHVKSQITCSLVFESKRDMETYREENLVCSVYDELNECSLNLVNENFGTVVIDNQGAPGGGVDWFAGRQKTQDKTRERLLVESFMVDKEQEEGVQMIIAEMAERCKRSPLVSSYTIALQKMPSEPVHSALSWSCVFVSDEAEQEFMERLPDEWTVLQSPLEEVPFGRRMKDLLFFQTSARVVVPMHELKPRSGRASPEPAQRLKRIQWAGEGDGGWESEEDGDDESSEPESEGD